MKQTDTLAENIKATLKELGEDPGREGLIKTPARAAKALREITSGYNTDFDALFNKAFYKTSSSDMVIISDINFYSMCEHHMLPFFGKVHVGYIPDGRIVGLSKIPRLVRALASRFQVQERLTHQIGATLMEKLTPSGVAVVAQARHMCMEMRGVKSERASAVTSAMLGVFKKDIALRDEFYRLIRMNKEP